MTHFFLLAVSKTLEQIYFFLFVEKQKLVGINQTRQPKEQTNMEDSEKQSLLGGNSGGGGARRSGGAVQFETVSDMARDVVTSAGGGGGTQTGGTGEQQVSVGSYIGPDELPPPYQQDSNSGGPVVTCRVCQAMIDISWKRDQHVVKCLQCNEATVSRQILFDLIPRPLTSSSFSYSSSLSTLSV